MDIDAKMVEEWGGELRVVATRLSRHFARSEPRQRVMAYIRGLLSDVPRKNGWQLAEQAGEGRPDGMQRLLSTSVWSAEALRDELQVYLVEALGEANGVLVVDESGFLKQGVHSAGVKRQYSGTAGRVANCQIGVFVAYGTQSGHALLDRVLYVPREWTDNRERCREAGIPDDVGFATKPALARVMIERAVAHHVPFAWVTGDTIYGGDRNLRLWLEEQCLPFVLAVPKDEPLWCEFRQVRADELARTISENGWQRLSCGDGAKGPRLYDWALVPLPRVMQPAKILHALLVRRSLSDGELAYCVVFAPADTSLQTLVNVAGQRWKVEECFELAKDEVGLDQYEVRHWTGWYRHITLAMWALAFLTVTRAQAVHLQAQKKAAALVGHAAAVGV
jgi:SRSO17 transposase